MRSGHPLERLELTDHLAIWFQLVKMRLTIQTAFSIQTLAMA